MVSVYLPIVSEHREIDFLLDNMNPVMWYSDGINALYSSGRLLSLYLITVLNNFSLITTKNLPMSFVLAVLSIDTAPTKFTKCCV